MAQALRTIWLEPEEQQHEPLVPRPRPQRRRRAAFMGWARLAFLILAVSCGVSALVLFVNTYAHIAEYEMQCQALKQEYLQLDRECIELNLELERLATQPRLARVAQVNGYELPTPDRVHYLQGVTDYPHADLAQAATVPLPSSWARRSGRQVLVALGSAWQLLDGETTHTAYAQD